MRTRNPLARRVIAALLMVLLNACYSWRPTTISPAQLIAEEEPSAVRVTLTDGRRLTFVDPFIDNDSLVQGYRAVPVVVSEISTVEVRRLSVTKSVLTSAAVAAFYSFAPYFDSDFGPDQ